MRERRQGWKTHLGRWVSTPVASPGARSAWSVVDLLYKIIDQFIILKKRWREEGNTYLCCFFSFPAVSLTSPIVFSVSTLSYLDFFSLVPVLTDEVACLCVTNADDGDGCRWPLHVVDLLDLVSGMVQWRCGGRDERWWMLISWCWSNVGEWCMTSLGYYSKTSPTTSVFFCEQQKSY